MEVDLKRVGVSLFAFTVAVLTTWALVRALAEPEPDRPARSEESASASLHAVTIRQPASASGVPTGELDAQGRPVTVSCSTCHSLLGESQVEHLSAGDVDEFHKFEFSHGNLRCLSCHNPEDPQSLRLADGEPIESGRVIDLCSQCHGPQRTDFDNGAHGGMTGYWDLTRGPRTRNSCTACHAPHSPGIPKVHPTFKPKDRFLSSSSTHSSEHPDTQVIDEAQKAEIEHE